MGLNVKKGRYGEELAKKHLHNDGYKLIQSNWTCHWGELDLIMFKDMVLIFIEVKYRRSLNYGYPNEAIRSKKLLSLQRSAKLFLRQNPKYYNFQIRIDVIGIFQDSFGSKPELVHYKNVASL